MNENKSPFGDDQFISFQDYSPINRAGGEALLDIDIPAQQPTNILTPQSSAPPLSENLTAAPEQNGEKPAPSFWTVEYYQKYFNVTTDDVLERIKRSVIPFGSDNYLVSHIRPNPDLYGPIWICITLIFSIAISGNMANYFHYANSGKFHWKYDFHLVSIVATCVFLYAWLLPMSIWGALKWTNSQENSNPNELIESNTTLGLIEILCVYGYSLSIYIPVAFLWTIQITWFQWTLVWVAAAISGGILLRSLSPAISSKHKFIYIAVIISMHLILAIGFMLYFFYGGSSSTPSIPSVVPTTVLPTVPPHPNKVNGSVAKD